MFCNAVASVLECIDVQNHRDLRKVDHACAAGTIRAGERGYAWLMWLSLPSRRSTLANVSAFKLYACFVEDNFFHVIAINSTSAVIKQVRDAIATVEPLASAA